MSQTKLKKYIAIFISLSIGLTIISMLTIKNISLKKDIKAEMDKTIFNYNYISSYKLYGYLNSSIELIVNNNFEKLSFENKQNDFHKIYNELGNTVIKNAVMHKIKVDTSKLVKSQNISTKLGNKIYSFNYGGLKTEKVNNNSNEKIANKTLSDDEIVEKIHSELKKNEDISELKQDIKDGNTYLYGKPNQEIDITMIDSFFDKKVSEQYEEISNIFESYLTLLRESGVKPYYNYIYVLKKGNEYKTYKISEDNFELIGLKKEMKREDIEENITILDNFDSKTVANGTYGGKSADEVKKETTTSTTSTTYSTPREPSDDNKAYAWTAAIAVVKDNLKAPSTAKFPWSYNNEYIKEIDYNTYVVKSYVDAENSFGAKIRSNFSVTIIKKSENSYTYKDLIISNN